MSSRASISSLVAGAVGLSLCIASPAAAAASSHAQPAVSPWVAFSAFGTSSSSAALCGAVAATGASVAAQGAAPGCVLPAVDAPPAPVTDAAVPQPLPAAAVPAASSAGIGVLPILLGLAGIVGLVAVLLSGNNDSDINVPITPQ